MTGLEKVSNLSWYFLYEIVSIPYVCIKEAQFNGKSTDHNASEVSSSPGEDHWFFVLSVYFRSIWNFNLIPQKCKICVTKERSKKAIL